MNIHKKIEQYKEYNRKKYFKQAKRNSILRKGNYFRRNLHINGISTDIKTVIIKTQQDMNNLVKGFKIFPDKTGYYRPRYFLKTLEPLALDSEVIIVKNKKVVDILECTDNFVKININAPVDLWFVKKGTIFFYNIKLNTRIGTR